MNTKILSIILALFVAVVAIAVTGCSDSGPFTIKLTTTAPDDSANGKIMYGILVANTDSCGGTALYSGSATVTARVGTVTFSDVKDDDYKYCALVDMDDSNSAANLTPNTGDMTAEAAVTADEDKTVTITTWITTP